MATFAKSWQETVPAGSDNAFNLDTYIKDLKIGANERHELEHYSWDDATSGADDPDNAHAQGRHKPGLASVTYVGTTTQIGNLSGMKKGSSAWDTTLSVLKIYNGSDWTTIQVSALPGSGLQTSLSSGDITASGISGLTDYANMLDQDSTTWTDEGTIAQDAIGYFYTDLSAEKSGWVRILADMKSANASGAVILDFRQGFDASELVTTTTYGGNFSNIAINTSSSYLKVSIIIPFWARYVGIRFSNSAGTGTCYIKFARFDVYATAV